MDDFDVLHIESASPDQTMAVGRLLGQLLTGGELLELNGPLGAGKTRFAKGLAIGLDVAESETVVSPTFVLVREYVGRVDFLHCDAYRLDSVEELRDLGLEEAVEGGAVAAIEWAERLPAFNGVRPITVEIKYGDDAAGREIEISALLWIIEEIYDALHAEKMSVRRSGAS